jgi:hypothetical protein
VRTRTVRLPDSADSRLLLAGVVAVLALVAYLGVAFARTHVSAAASPSGPNIAPWVPLDSKFVRLARRKEHSFSVRFERAGKGRRGTYGALVPTLVPQPKSGRRYVVGLWLKASRPGRIGIEVDEFSPAAESVYLVNTTVHATRSWRHFTFDVPVKGTWLGLGMYVYRTDRGHRTWFAVRDLTESAAPS